jgi:hypothetical protein
MTRFLIAIFIFLGKLALGQSIDSITEINFKYSKGHSSWGKPGKYSRSESLVFKKNDDRNFELIRFFRVINSAGKDGRTFTKDTTHIFLRKNTIINSHCIQNWLNQLNTEKENYNEVYIKPLLKIPSKNEITNVAKLIDKELFFDKDFREEKKAVIEKIQDFYRLDSFLINTKSNTDNLMVVVDAWNLLRVEVISKNDTTIYHSQFRFPIGQPIVRYERNDFSRGTNIFNLEVNTAAQTFLPKESLIYNVLDINNIKQQYIKYCMENYFY